MGDLELAPCTAHHPCRILCAPACRLEGPAGLEERSRAAKRPAGRISAELEDQIVAARKRLFDDGLEGGPGSVHSWLEDHGVRDVPSEATIWRVFVRRGQVVPAPHKRPKGSGLRFERERPNECWQIDATHWELASGAVIEVINIIDDRSRVCVDAFAVRVCTSPAAWQAFSRASQRYGLPAEVLSDNNAAFRSYADGAKPPVFERNLHVLGIRTLHSRPHHPQTCGKVERFHQTQKRWLTKRPPARTLTGLQRQLDGFREIYNRQRPHRSIGRQRPADVWNALPKAQPAHPTIHDEIIIRDHRVLTGAITRQGRIVIERRPPRPHERSAAHEPVTSRRTAARDEVRPESDSATPRESAVHAPVLTSAHAPVPPHMHAPCFREDLLAPESTRRRQFTRECATSAGIAS